MTVYVPGLKYEVARLLTRSTTGSKSDYQGGGDIRRISPPSCDTMEGCPLKEDGQAVPSVTTERRSHEIIRRFNGNNSVDLLFGPFLVSGRQTQPAGTSAKPK